MHNMAVVSSLTAKIGIFFCARQNEEIECFVVVHPELDECGVVCF